MANRQIIDIGVNGASFDVNLGRICDGDTIELQFCNSDGSHTYSFSCTCPAFTGLPSTQAFDVCQCRTYTLTYVGDGVPGIGSCTILASRSGGNVVRVNLTWEEVYCELTTTAWSLDDASSIVEIDNSTFDAGCEVFHGSCMANRNIFSITHTLTQPLVVGDEIYFSQWLFAQIVNWAYQDYPVAGWKYRVCLFTPEEGEPSVDGTFKMEWYGEQPSEENSAQTPYIGCVIGSGGTTITITIQFNMPADTTQPAGNNFINNHDVLLKNSVRNGLIINNESENSVYRNPKYLTWATVVYRTIGAVYQDAIFSIKAELPFYNEPSVTLSPMRLILNSITLARTATGTSTDYLSTTRGTSVVVDFDYISSNVSGTPPDAMWVYMIRNDAQNNQLDYYENYEYEQANLTTLAVSANITPTVAPTNVTGNNFQAEFDISALHPDLEGVNGISLNYRFIFVAMSAVDQETRSTITPQPIQLINYDDEAMPLGSLDVVWRTVEQEYAGTVQTLQSVPVNMDLEASLRLDLSATNAELSAKTGGLLTDARESLTAVRLDVYEENPLTGNLLLDTMFFQPQAKNTCGAIFTEEGMVSQGSGGNIEMTFPFTIPDNIYRNIGREGLFQRVQGQFQRVPVVDASLDCVIATQVNQCNFGTSFGSMQSGVVGAEYSQQLTYIPTTQEVWALDITNVEIHIFDANSFTFITAVALPASNIAYAEYCPANNSVYISDVSGNDVYCISVTSRTITSTIGISIPAHILSGIKYISQTQELIVVNNSTSEIVRINVNTNTIVGVPIVLGAGAGAQQIEFIPAINEIWVACNTSNSVERVNYTTLTHVGSIAVTSAFAIKLVGAEVWVGQNSIDVINVNSLAIVQSIVITYSFDYFTEFGGVIYTSDPIDSIFGYDTQSYNVVTNLFIGTGSKPSFILLANGILYVGGGTPTDTIYLFDADCQQQLPPFSMRNRNIIFDWQMEFQIFDNTEIYHAFQTIERPQGELEYSKINPADFITDIEVEYPEDPTPTPIPIGDATPCATTGVINVNAQWGGSTVNRQMFGVAVQIVPFRGGMISSESAQPVAGNIIIPVNSPFIRNLTPQFGVNADINFDIDYPNLPIQGDYEIKLHFFIRP
jgi:hypothetical protein